MSWRNRTSDCRGIFVRPGTTTGELRQTSMARRGGPRRDVHGNQVALTQRSRCYQNSQMTCATCHEVHAPERAAASYSEKCLQCHQDRDRGEFLKLGAKIRENCIDCHMPLQNSNLIVSDLNAEQFKARIRNHWIKVYPMAQKP